MAGFRTDKVHANYTAYSVICGPTSAPGTMQNVSGVGTSGQILTSNGAGALPTWQANAGATSGGEWTLISNTSASGDPVSITSGLGTTYDQYLIMLDAVGTSAATIVQIQFSDDGGSTYNVTVESNDRSATNTMDLFNTDSGAVTGTYFILFQGNKGAIYKPCWSGGRVGGGGNSAEDNYVIATTNDIDAFQILTNDAATLDAGTIRLYGK